jgi:hypothetical protein
MPIAIDDFELTWYMHEICMHSLGADREYERLKVTLAEDATRQKRIVWFHLTAFLSHAAMISKYLSPIGRSEVASARKQALRDRLGVDSASDVLPRDARDNVEHFDERLDNWVGRGNQEILEIVLPNRSGYKYLNVQSKRVKRVLLLDEMSFISEKRDSSQFELELEPLHLEIVRIGTAAETWVKTKSPYHFVYPR